MKKSEQKVKKNLQVRPLVLGNKGREFLLTNRPWRSLVNKRPILRWLHSHQINSPLLRRLSMGSRPNLIVRIRLWSYLLRKYPKPTFAPMLTLSVSVFQASTVPWWSVEQAIIPWANLKWVLTFRMLKRVSLHQPSIRRSRTKEDVRRSFFNRISCLKCKRRKVVYTLMVRQAPIIFLNSRLSPLCKSHRPQLSRSRLIAK